MRSKTTYDIPFFQCNGLQRINYVFRFLCDIPHLSIINNNKYFCWFSKTRFLMSNSHNIYLALLTGCVKFARFISQQEYYIN